MIKRPMMWVGLAFVLGAGLRLLKQPVMAWGIFVGILAVIVGRLGSRHCRFKRREGMRLLGFAGLLSFFVWTGGFRVNQALIPPELDGWFQESLPVQVIGQVGKTVVQGDTLTLYMNKPVIYIRGKGPYSGRRVTECRLIVYGDSETAVYPGDVVETTGDLSRFKAATNPGGFDSKAYYQAQKLDYPMYSKNLKVIENGSGPKILGEKLWRALAGVYDTHLNEENAEIIKTMVLGRGRLLSEIKDLYQETGIRAVLSISGLHIGLLGLVFFKLCHRSWVHRYVAACMSVVLTIFYGLMCGMGVSVLRAVVMFGLLTGSQILGRAYDWATISVFTLALLIWDMPLMLTQGGLWLSFVAVFGIGLMAGPLRQLFGNHSLGQKASITLAVSLVLWPVNSWFFYEIPLLGPIMNLLVSLTVGPLLPLALLGGLAGLTESVFHVMGVVTGLLLGIVELILWVYKTLCLLVTRLPFCQVLTGQPQLWQIGMYYTLVIPGVYLLKKGMNSNGIVDVQKQTPWFLLRYHKRLAGLLTLVALIILILPIPDCELTVTFVDVGQGECILMEIPENVSIMVDCGSSSEDKVGEYTIEPLLKYKDIKAVDYMIITHMDWDHYSALTCLMETHQVKNLILNGSPRWSEQYQSLETLAKEQGIEIYYMLQGDEMTFGDLRIECLWPNLAHNNMDDNDLSLVLSVAYGNFHMLLTGDAEMAAEDVLLEAQLLKAYDVLKVAHHGSGGATDTDFLQVIKPKLAIISCGQNNIYGHPHPDTIARLKQTQCSIYCTKDVGAVTLRTDGNKITLEGYTDSGVHMQGYR